MTMAQTSQEGCDQQDKRFGWLINIGKKSLSFDATFSLKIVSLILKICTDLFCQKVDQTNFLFKKSHETSSMLEFICLSYIEQNSGTSMLSLNSRWQDTMMIMKPKSSGTNNLIKRRSTTRCCYKSASCEWSTDETAQSCIVQLPRAEATHLIQADEPVNERFPV